MSQPQVVTLCIQYIYWLLSQALTKYNKLRKHTHGKENQKEECVQV